jgi:hypothetical protein
MMKLLKINYHNWINPEHVVQIYRHESVDEVMASLELINGSRITIYRARVSSDRMNLPELRSKAKDAVDLMVEGIECALYT